MAERGLLRGVWLAAEPLVFLVGVLAVRHGDITEVHTADIRGHPHGGPSAFDGEALHLSIQNGIIRAGPQALAHDDGFPECVIPCGHLLAQAGDGGQDAISHTTSFPHVFVRVALAHCR